MLYLWIARHGLTQHNVDGIIQGHYDTDLNDEGLFQAKLLSEWLEEHCQFFDLILTSPLKRARDTALTIYARQPRSCQWRIDPGLIERDMGEWNNHKVVRPPRPKIIKVQENPHSSVNETQTSNHDQEQDEKTGTKKDAPEEKADGSLGLVRVVEKPERRSRSQRREMPVERDGQVEDSKVYQGEEARQRDIERMMSGVELRGDGEGSKEPARVANDGDHKAISIRQANSGSIAQGAPQGVKLDKDKVDPQPKKAVRPPQPKVPGMESREAMEARCFKWADQVIRDGLDRSWRTRQDVAIMAVSHGAFISCLLDVLTWPREKGGLFGFKFDGLQDHHCYNTSFSVVEIDLRGKGRFLCNNHVPHLEQEATLMNPDDFAQ